MAKRVRLIAVGFALVIICCGAPVLGGIGLYGLLNRGAASRYNHAYPAPGPGCGDRVERESGVKTDLWDNQDYAGVHCYPDHVDIDAGGDPDPRGVHTIGANLFKLETDIGGPTPYDVSPDGRLGFLLTLTVQVRSGGPDARAGITIDLYAPMRTDANAAGYPVYFFNVDLAGRWHVATHDGFGAFLSDLDRGAGAQPAADRVLRLRLDAHAGTMTFTVDGTVATTVHPPKFETYRLGVGLACSYDPQNRGNCLASARDYRYEATS
jgi:hypothetical protein